MPTGFKSINDSSTVQIDENYTNLHMTSKHVTVLTKIANFPGGFTNYRLELTVTGTNPLAAFVGDGIILVSRVKSGSSFTFLFSCGLPVRSSDAPATVPITVYIFDGTMSGQSPAGAHFLVRNASNLVVFHDRMKVMRIVDYISESANDGEGKSTVRTYRAGSTVAIMPSMDGQYVLYGSGDGGLGNITYMFIFGINGTTQNNKATLRYTRNHFQTFGSPYWDVATVPQIYRSLILDVTGY